SRFDPQSEGYDLGVQRQTAGVQISLNRIRGTKIGNGPGSHQPQPPLGLLLKLNLRPSRGRDPRIGSFLRTDYSHPQEQPHQAFHNRALTSFSARSISFRACAEPTALDFRATRGAGFRTSAPMDIIVDVAPPPDCAQY